MIQRIELCFFHAVKVKHPDVVEFRPGLNVIVGPNGAGKSTILNALHTCKECVIDRAGSEAGTDPKSKAGRRVPRTRDTLEPEALDDDAPGRTVTLNTELNNPRTTTYGTHKRSLDEVVLQVRAGFSSHGQSLRDAFARLRFGPRDTLLIDEPESGMDFDNLVAIRAALDSVAAQGVQVIVASHHPLLWRDCHLIALGPKGYLRTTTAAWRRALKSGGG